MSRVNDYHFSDPVDPHDAGATTGHHIAEAGRGDYAALSAQRWAQRRAWQQPAIQPVQSVTPDLVLDLSRTSAFVEGVANSLHRDVKKDMAVGAVLGGALGLVLGKARENNVRQAK